MKRMILENEKTTVFSYYSLIVLTILFMLVGGLGIKKGMENRGASSTKLGSTGNFERSQATATLSGYYTDKNKDVLIAVIKLQENNASPLPYIAKDYLVTYKGNGTLDAYFGRYSTDGDLFVIIPNPRDNETYNIQITNKTYMGIDSKATDDSNLEDLKGSVSKQLSVVSKMGESAGSVDSDKQSKTDTISFQMTISPKITSEEYKVKVIDTPNDTLLEKNDKGNLVFDFKLYWNALYRQPNIDQAEDRLTESIKRQAELTQQYNRAKQRFDKNNKDEVAKQQVKMLENQIENEVTKQENISEKIKQYRKIKYNSDDFSDYTTKIYGLE